MTDLRIPADLLPADGRFGCGPSKIRPEAVAALAGEGARLLGTSHRQTPGQEPGRRRPQRSGRALRAPGRLRGRARQRRLDDLLGRRRELVDRAAERARQLRGVLGQVRRRGRRGPPPRGAERRDRAGRFRRRPDGRARRRRLRLGPQRDLDRRPRPGAAGRGRRRGRPGRRRRNLRGRRRRPGRQPDRRLLLRPAEELRLRGRAVVRPAVPRRRRARRTDRRLRALDPGEPEPGRRPDELPPRPDPEHPGGRHPVPHARPAAVAGRPRRAGRRGGPHRRLRLPHLRLGRDVAVRDPVRQRTRPTAPPSSRPSTSRASTRRPWPPPCGPTGSSTPSPTASSAATSCASACSRTSTPTTSARSARASTGWSPASGPERHLDAVRPGRQPPSTEAQNRW